MAQKKKAAGKTAQAPEAADLRFEDGIEKLETIVKNLEQGDLPLDESISLFQQGVELARQLEGRLGEAEMKVEQLIQAAGGDAKLAPLQIDVEDEA